MRVSDAWPTVLDASDRCPCRSGNLYGECCGALHAGVRTAPTAQQLMRSRYVAFVVGERDYLLATWHPRTRPTTLDLDPEVTWLSLEIMTTQAGGPFDETGIVEFTARFGQDGARGSQREVSRFVREGGRWFYLDAL